MPSVIEGKGVQASEGQGPLLFLPMWTIFDQQLRLDSTSGPQFPETLWKS